MTSESAATTAARLFSAHIYHFPLHSSWTLHISPISYLLPSLAILPVFFIFALKKMLRWLPSIITEAPRGSGRAYQCLGAHWRGRNVPTSTASQLKQAAEEEWINKTDCFTFCSTSEIYSEWKSKLWKSWLAEQLLIAKKAQWKTRALFFVTSLFLIKISIYLFLLTFDRSTTEMWTDEKKGKF